MKAVIIEGSMEEITALLNTQGADRTVVSVEAVRASIAAVTLPPSPAAGDPSPAARDPAQGAAAGLPPVSIGVTEAAKLLGISDREVRNLARQDGFPSYRIGKRIMISYDGLRQWSAARACV